MGGARGLRRGRSRRCKAGRRTPGLEGRGGRAWPGLRCVPTWKRALASAGPSSVRLGASGHTSPSFWEGTCSGLWPPPFCPLRLTALCLGPCLASFCLVGRRWVCTAACGLPPVQRPLLCGARPWSVRPAAEARGLRGPVARGVFLGQRSRLCPLHGWARLPARWGAGVPGVCFSFCTFVLQSSPRNFGGS